MKFKNLALLAFAISTLAGCSVSQTVPTPFKSNGSSLESAAPFMFINGHAAVTESAEANKSGTSCAYNVLGLVAFGDSSVETVKENNQINDISSVDYDLDQVTFFQYTLFKKFCTIVNGS